MVLAGLPAACVSAVVASRHIATTMKRFEDAILISTELVAVKQWLVAVK